MLLRGVVLVADDGTQTKDRAARAKTRQFVEGDEKNSAPEGAEKEIDEYDQDCLINIDRVGFGNLFLHIHGDGFVPYDKLCLFFAIS